MNISTFLIKSRESGGFGTGFSIDTDLDGSFLLTCRHVVEGESDLEVNHLEVEVLENISSNELIDLAVIYVKGLKSKPLKLSLELIEEDDAFFIDGFKEHKEYEYKFERLLGSIKKVSQIYTEDNYIDSYELSIGERDFIEDGYSGSAIVSKKSGKVVAVATDKVYTGKEAYAIPIKYLQSVWSNFKPTLFSELSPFVGLNAFSYYDRSYFFGRDREIEDIIKRLEQSNILAIMGDSGSGKSSLIKAGVLPRYYNSSSIIEMRPAQNPFSELIFSLNRVFEEYNESDISSFIKDIKSRNPESIHTVLERLYKKKSRVIIYIDQFEELFTLCSEALQQEFIDILLFILKNQTRHLEIKIIFSIRRDYFNPLTDYKRFYMAIENQTYLVKRMSDKSLKEVIEKPLELLSVDQTTIKQLSGVIVADMGDEAKEITLLQIALSETWTNRANYNNDLLASYIGIGRVTGALSRLATNVMDSLSPKEKELFKYIFIRIVTFNDMGGVTRRLATQDEFSEESWRLVQKLAGRGLGRLLKLKSSKTEKREAVIELIHETLVTQWSTYIKWLRKINKENRKRVHDDLIDKSKIYKIDSNSKILLTGYVLEESLKLLDKEYIKYLSIDEKSFIEMSKRRENRIKLISIIGLFGLIILVLLSGYLAYRAEESANKLLGVLNSSNENAITIFTSEDYKKVDLIFNNIYINLKNMRGKEVDIIVSKALLGQAFIAHKRYGKDNKNDKSYAKAIEFYSELIKRFKNNSGEILRTVATALWNKALLLKDRDENKTIETFNQLIEQFKESKDKDILNEVAMSYNSLAWYSLLDGDFNASLKFIEKSRDINDTDGAKINLLYTYLCLGYKDKAFEIYDKIEDKNLTLILGELDELQEKGIKIDNLEEVKKKLRGE